MHCDPCLMLIYRSFKGNKRAKEVFFALAKEDFPTHDTLIHETGLTLHHVRDALNFLRGAGLVWGDSCHGLSESGHRLLELLRDTDQPEPSEALCDDCLLEIGELLPADGYSVLAHLSSRHVRSRHDLLIGTELTVARLRDALVTLEGACLIQSARGRSFRLSETGRRLERLLRRWQRASQWDSIGSIRDPSVGEPLPLGAATRGRRQL
jgi:hypothetical protein